MNLYIRICVLLLTFSINGLFAQSSLINRLENKFVIIAHRGDHTEAPENTIAAYRNAILAGVDFVEIDLRTTKDSQLVIMHDANLNNMAGINAKISDLNYDSLRNIKIFAKNHLEWGFYSIPTFDEVLSLCKNKINIYLDFKNASAKQAYNLITKYGMEQNVVVYINSPQQLVEWKSVAPNMPLMISLPKKISTGMELEVLVSQFKMDILDGDYNEYNEEIVIAAKKMHIPIWADIQSNEEGPVQWDKAIKVGLRGLQTDHPKAIIDYLKLNGLK